MPTYTGVYTKSYKQLAQFFTFLNFPFIILTTSRIRFVLYT
jgi:hypothetical protein